MKSKINIAFFLFIFIFELQASYADEINFDVTKLEIYENGNLIKGLDGGKAIINENTEITADYFEYDKLTTLLKAFGNAVLVDKKNETIIKAEKILYLKNKEKFFTEGPTYFNIEEQYEGESADVVFFRNTMITKSDKKTSIKDKETNKTFYLESFLYNFDEEILKGLSVKVIDEKENDIYYFNKAIIDLKNNKMLGQDIDVDFDNNKFENNINEPRLKGVVSFSDANKTIVDKGLFTICKKRGDKCPPWVVKAEKITHDKEKKTLYYKNALLKIYDIPVWYYPYFFHPDPSVKRQSGFIKAATNNSKSTGQSIYLPYFYAISENKDLTIKPYIFGNKKIVLQNEYRYINENSITIADFSYSKGHHSYWDTKDYDSSTTKTHLFVDTKIDLELENFETSDLNFTLQKSSNDTYLSLFKLKSVLFDSPTTLTSGLDLALDNEYTSFDLGINQYEKLSGLNTDRYTRSLPSYSLSRSIALFDNLNLGSLSFGSDGNNTLSATNIVETKFINNLNYTSEDKFFDIGLISKAKILLRNVNSSGKNSLKYDSNLSIDGMSIFLHETSFPLIQYKNTINNILTPKISFRYSPNKGRDLSDSGKKINIGNIFDIGRVGESDAVETGASMTIGLNYQKLDTEKDKKKFEFDIATNLRKQEEPDLPTQSTINRTTSDLVGMINYMPNEIFNIAYDFSLDNDMNTLNNSQINTTIQTNKLKTDLIYAKQSEFFGSANYLQTDIKYNFDTNQNLTFGTRRNRKIGLTEYYNLIYDYKNDCLIASIDYKKSYYQDRDIKPTEDLFFQITIVPITSYESTNLIEKVNKWENKASENIDKLLKPGEWK